MGVSKNRGTPKIINFNMVFHYKPSILGVKTLFWETPICRPNMPKNQENDYCHFSPLKGEIFQTILQNGQRPPSLFEIPKTCIALGEKLVSTQCPSWSEKIGL